MEIMGLNPCALVGHIPRPVQLVFATTGAIWLLTKSLNCLRFLFSVFIARGRNLRKYGGRGTWAVVTGASDGLGKEFALQLAAQGFSLVLVSRTQSKLDAVADEIAARFGSDKGAVRTRTLAIDFARDDAADYGRLAELVVGLDIGILINNVGQSHNIPVPFAHTAPDELQSIVAVNCLGTLKTTQAVLPAMLARRRPGLILTMGSFAGWTPTPYLATYSGSKAFLQQWSSALAEELRPQGIEVQICLSYLITTAMSKVRRASSLVPAPRPFVRAALAKIGSGRWQEAAYTFTPWWSHAAMLYAVESTIGAANRLLVWYNLVMHRAIRNQALRKAARQAKERQQQPQEEQ